MYFKNKKVMVTGAGGGSGKAIAEKFLKEGAIVLAVDLKSPQWHEANDKFYPVAMDVSSEEAVEKTISDFCEKNGAIDILVNNAGIAPAMPLVEFELSTWQKIFAVNAEGTFLCTRAVVRRMLDTGVQEGSIINIASIAGKNGFANSCGYCASKSAIIGFTRALALELGEHHITVNAICPGTVATPMIEGVIDSICAETGKGREDVRTMMESGIPMKRFQEPEDVANLVCFLASDAARNISGETMNLDGGVVRD